MRMRHIALAVALAASSPASAQVPLPERVGAVHPYMSILVEADANQDGLVTMAEIDAYVASDAVRAQAKAEEAWTNQMALLGLLNVSAPTTEQVVRGFDRMINLMDADRDGQVSVQEGKAFSDSLDGPGRLALRRLLTALGPVRDGSVSREDRAALLARATSPDPILMTHDAFVAKEVEAHRTLVQEVRSFWSAVGGGPDTPLSLNR